MIITGCFWRGFPGADPGGSPALLSGERLRNAIDEVHVWFCVLRVGAVCVGVSMCACKYVFE